MNSKKMTPEYQLAQLTAREHCVASAYRCARELARNEGSCFNSREIARIVCDAYKLAGYIETGIAREVAKLRKYEEPQS